MRTTIEITDEQRSRLLAIAAARGEKGFSLLVREAIDLYLHHLEQAERESLLQRSLGAVGSLSESEAAEMERAVGEVREVWR